MKKLFFLLFATLAALTGHCQSSTLPSDMGDFNLFKKAKAPVSIIMPPGYALDTAIVEIWNNGIKLSDSTATVISGDTVKFTIMPGQLAPLTRESYVYVRFKADPTISPVLGGKLITKLTVGTPVAIAKKITLPSGLIARVSVIPEMSSILTAAATVTAQANLAKTYRDSTASLMVIGSERMNSRLKKGSLAVFRANTEIIDAFALVDKLKSGDFYADVLDTTTPDDTVMTVISGGIRYKRRVQEYVNPLWWGAVGDSLTDDAVAIRKAAAYATAKKKTLLIENGYVFTIYSTVNFGCNIDGFGTIKTRSNASLTGTLSNIAVKNITIVGKHNNVNEGRGLYFAFLANVTVDNVKAFSTISQGIFFNGVPYARVINCRTANTRGEYGDGIYFSNCLNPTAMNNYTRDFQRIGIVFEGNCTNWIATGNICKDSYPSFVTQINGGIWAERTRGGIASNNHIENVRDKAITITPNSLSTLGKTYPFVVSGNTMIKVREGVNFPASQDQILTYSDNMNIDVARPIEIGQCQEATISNSTFAARDSSGAYFLEMIRFVPTTEVGKRSKLTIVNCKNYVNSITIPAINIPNGTGINADLNVMDCRVGNWSYYLFAGQISGEVRFTNTNIDFAPLTSGSWYFANSTKAIFDNCDIKLPTISLNSLGLELTIRDSRITADALARIIFFSSGSQTIRVERSKLNNVYFYDIRRADSKIHLIDSEFDNYQTTGLFQLMPTLVNTLEVRGCKFSESQTGVVPLQFTNGVTNPIIGENYYFNTGSLYSGFAVTRQTTISARGTTANRPTVTQLGFRYYDISINREIYWNGTEWIIPPLFAANAATTAPNKSGLNTTYGAYGAGSRISYPSITGGGRDYIKLSNSSTSDWDEYVRATGVTSTLP